MLESLGSFEGKYEILARIGEGGMGAVYKVRHRLLDEIRVIKTMRSHLMNKDESKERFFREARLASQVRHENIAQVLDFSIDDEVAFLVIEYIDGVTLQEILATGTQPSFALALEMAQQSLRALAFVHRTGIIHRDISPDNLMLMIDGEGNPKIKLIDLGLAKLTDADSGLTKEGFFLGKLRYAAPEQFQTQVNDAVGSWSDVYSFGLVFYELLTGRYPIRGRDMAGLMAGHLTKPPIPFSDSDPDGLIPEEARRLVLQALAKNPNDRFPTGENFHDQVRLVQFDHPIGPDERDEAIRLIRRPDQETDSKKPDSDQKRVSHAFPAKKSSAGTSHSEDVTGSMDSDEIAAGGPPAVDHRATQPADTPKSRKTRQADLGKTIVRKSDPPLSPAAEVGHEPEAPGVAAHPPAGVQPEASAPVAESAVPVREGSEDVTISDQPQPHVPPEPSDRDAAEPSIAAISDRMPVRTDTTTARVDRRALRRKWLRLAGAAGIVGGIVAAILLLTGVISIPDLGGDTDETVVGAAIGTLVVDASPWAEVVEVVGSNGERVNLNGIKYTPLVVALTPGSYDVVLRNAQYGEKTLRANVRAGETTSDMVPFANIDEDQLLQSLDLIE